MGVSLLSFWMNKYIYDGPVMEFGRCITAKFHAETYAETPQKAKANVAFQFKKRFGKEPTSRISLPGKIKEEPR